MTFAIRHHTEQLHRKATKCVPTVTTTDGSYRIHDERGYAEAMKEAALKEGHMGRAPCKPAPFPPRRDAPPPMPEIDAAILRALTRELTTSEIAKIVGHSKAKVACKLNGPLADHVSRRDARMHGSRVVLWSLAHEPHVSCKDRIAAAKAEAQ